MNLLLLDHNLTRRRSLSATSLDLRCSTMTMSSENSPAKIADIGKIKAGEETLKASVVKFSVGLADVLIEACGGVPVFIEGRREVRKASDTRRAIRDMSRDLNKK